MEAEKSQGVGELETFKYAFLPYVKQFECSPSIRGNHNVILSHRMLLSDFMLINFNAMYLASKVEACVGGRMR